MPQGGIDEGEEAYPAALRELFEETSIRSVEKIAEIPEWLHYDLPKDIANQAWKGRYRGQKQKWFALRFIGKESEIDISCPGRTQAGIFAWRWEPMKNLPSLIIPFKRPVYDRVVEEFAHLAK